MDYPIKMQKNHMTDYDFNLRNYTVFIMHGWSGSGKSTYVKQNINNSGKYRQDIDAVCSADSYFKKDYSDFSEDLLPLAHKACFNKFKSALDAEIKSIWVDNTNTVPEHVEPYIELAKKHKYKVIHIFCTNNYEGKAPDDVIKRQKQDLFNNYGIGD